jgi:hypothetical protein
MTERFIHHKKVYKVLAKDVTPSRVDTETSRLEVNTLVHTTSSTC